MLTSGVFADPSRLVEGRPRPGSASPRASPSRSPAAPIGNGPHAGGPAREGPAAPTSPRRTDMARKPLARGAPWWCSSWAGDRLRAGRARRHLEARAGPGPPGRHPHHADRQGLTRARASTRRATIIDQRVNGSGVTEAEVTTQGNSTSWSRSRARAGATWSTPSSARRSCASAWSPAASTPRPRTRALGGRHARRHAGRRTAAPVSTRARAPSPSETSSKNRAAGPLANDQNADQQTAAASPQPVAVAVPDAGHPLRAGTRSTSRSSG